MSKYAPLGDYLRSCGIIEVRMSFEDIERIIGARLPEKAQAQRAWWSNNASNNVMTRVWLEAGYETQRVDMAARRLVFRRTTAQPASAAGRGRSRPPATPPPAEPPAPTAPVRGARHPLLGLTKGMIRVGAGTDLTQPVDPYWGVR